MSLTLKECKLTPKKIELFNRCNITNSDDMLTYYPFRYEQLEAKPFDQWVEKDRVAFEGRIIKSPYTVHFGHKRTMSRFEVMLDDENVIQCAIFNRPWARQLKDNQRITIIAKYDGGNKVTALSYNLKPLKDQLGLKPVYPLKDELTQNIIRDNMKKVYDASCDSIENLVPNTFIKKYQLLNRYDAFKFIHFPDNYDQITKAYRTLKYEEFLKFHLALQMMRKDEIIDDKQSIKTFDQKEIERFISSLPYTLTPDQLTAVNDILKDLRSNHNMYRLVQGDVGCGKTLVSAIGMYGAVLARTQACLLAPTEILAKQHYHTLKELFKMFNINIAVLYSALPNKEKEVILNDLSKGDIDIIVGTHSLIEDQVSFKNLGMVVVDEQQRFGVEQRKKIKAKGEHADFLLMSATPIPRTLANALYGDMNVSSIETMPKGRKPVKTKLIKENSFRTVVNDITSKLKDGKQIYVICAAIEENDEIKVRDVNTIGANLKKAFKDIAAVGILHGKLTSEEKEKVMKKFEDNEVQILVSTTVVEVGVNVVNATTMIIYDADRFGLSQLHQLRGRVQRGSDQGTCYLLTGSSDQDTLARLEALVKTSNGFEIAAEDLRLRGPGDILGTRQSGLPGFILGNPLEDTKIINQAKEDAMIILSDTTNKDYANILESINTLSNSEYVD